jgi:hypothetical protein
VRPIAAQDDDEPTRDRGDEHGRPIQRRQCRAEHKELRDERPRLRARQRQPEQVLDLARQDDDGDAGREPDRDRVGNVLDEGTEPQQPDAEQDQPGQEGREHKPVDPVLRDGGCDEYDESASRPTDLEPAAAERRDHEPADDRGREAAVGGDAGRDGDRH